MFRYKCIQKYYCRVQIWGGGEGGRTQWNLGKVVIILSVIPIVFVLMNGHLVFYEDRKQTLEEPWGKIDSVI